MSSAQELSATPNSNEVRCLRWARLLALGAVVIGVGVLLGWGLHLTLLMSVLPGLVAMKPNAAVNLILGGASIFLLAQPTPEARQRWRLYSAVLAGLLVLVGLLTMAEYLTERSFGLDELLFRDRFLSKAPGRMAPLTTINSVCIGAAVLLLLFTRGVLLAQGLAAVPAFTSILAIVGFVYGVESLYESGNSTAVALHTSAAFLFLWAGVWCASSQRAFMRLATNPRSSGMLVRRCMPAVIIPLLVGWLRVQSVKHGIFSNEVGIVLVAMSNATAFVVLVWIGAWFVRVSEDRQILARQALRDSEERLNLVVENLTEGLLIWNVEGVLLHWNQAALSMYGFATQEQGRRLWPEFTRLFEMSTLEGVPLPPERWPMRCLLAGEQVRNTELRVRRHDQGWERVYRYAGSLVKGRDGKQLAFLTISDVTSEKEALERFYEVANALSQLIWTARPDGFVDYYNERWYEYTGGRRGDFGDDSWGYINHPEDLPIVQREWAKSVAAGIPFKLEFRLRRASDGQYRWFLILAEPIKDAEGRVQRWIGTCTDIHESKLLREQNELLLGSERAARTEAERGNRMKDEFLATLSHELRTPLNAILGWTQVLRGDPANSPDVEDGLTTIERNARAQSQIIDDLLDMSRIISGKVRLDVQPVDLGTIVEAAVETQLPAAAAKGIQLQQSLDPEARIISGDPNRLQQVFWNLLSNAIKFTPKEGQVHVAVERIHSHVEVSITDTGEGIAAEFLPYVFDRFRQQDASTTRKHGGLGLGLAITKQLVELHGGGIHVDSKGVGCGTTFRVILPLRAIRQEVDEPFHLENDFLRTPHGTAAITVEQLDLSGLRVLVVDDEADARALLKRLLEDRGMAVQTAGSAAQALELLKAELPDILVSDIGMPAQDGYSLIQQVRELPPGEGGQIPAVALTAYARPEDRLKMIQAGFQIHLAKPVEARELLVAVANLTGRATMPSEA